MREGTTGMVTVRSAAMADVGAVAALFDAYRQFCAQPPDPAAPGWLCDEVFCGYGKRVERPIAPFSAAGAEAFALDEPARPGR